MNHIITLKQLRLHLNIYTYQHYTLGIYFGILLYSSYNSSMPVETRKKRRTFFVKIDIKHLEMINEIIYFCENGIGNETIDFVSCFCNTCNNPDSLDDQSYLLVKYVSIANTRAARIAKEPAATIWSLYSSRYA